MMGISPRLKRIKQHIFRRRKPRDYLDTWNSADETVHRRCGPFSRYKRMFGSNVVVRIEARKHSMSSTTYIWLPELLKLVETRRAS